MWIERSLLLDQSNGLFSDFQDTSAITLCCGFGRIDEIRTGFQIEDLVVVIIQSVSVLAFLIFSETEAAKRGKSAFVAQRQGAAFTHLFFGERTAGPFVSGKIGQDFVDLFSVFLCGRRRNMKAGRPRSRRSTFGSSAFATLKLA